MGEVSIKRNETKAWRISSWLRKSSSHRLLETGQENWRKHPCMFALSLWFFCQTYAVGDCQKFNGVFGLLSSSKVATFVYSRSQRLSLDHSFTAMAINTFWGIPTQPYLQSAWICQNYWIFYYSPGPFFSNSGLCFHKFTNFVILRPLIYISWNKLSHTTRLPLHTCSFLNLIKINIFFFFLKEIGKYI